MFYTFTHNSRKSILSCSTFEFTWDSDSLEYVKLRIYIYYSTVYTLGHVKFIIYIYYSTVYSLGHVNLRIYIYYSTVYTLDHVKFRVYIYYSIYSQFYVTSWLLNRNVSLKAFDLKFSSNLIYTP